VSIVQALLLVCSSRRLGQYPTACLHRRLAFGCARRAAGTRTRDSGGTLILAFVLQSYWRWWWISRREGPIHAHADLGRAVRPGRPGPDTKVGELRRFGES